MGTSRLVDRLVAAARGGELSDADLARASSAPANDWIEILSECLLDRELAVLLDLTHPGETTSARWTTKAVKSRRLRMGLAKEGLPEVDRLDLRQLWERGMNAKEIASQLGCTPGTARQLLWREGLETDNGRRRIG